LANWTANDPDSRRAAPEAPPTTSPCQKKNRRYGGHGPVTRFEPADGTNRPRFLPRHSLGSAVVRSWRPDGPAKFRPWLDRVSTRRGTSSRRPGPATPAGRGFGGRPRARSLPDGRGKSQRPPSSGVPLADLGLAGWSPPPHIDIPLSLLLVVSCCCCFFSVFFVFGPVHVAGGSMYWVV